MCSSVRGPGWLEGKRTGAAGAILEPVQAEPHEEPPTVLASLALGAWIVSSLGGALWVVAVGREVVPSFAARGAFLPLLTREAIVLLDLLGRPEGWLLLGALLCVGSLPFCLGARGRRGAVLSACATGLALSLAAGGVGALYLPLIEVEKSVEVGGPAQRAVAGVGLGVASVIVACGLAVARAWVGEVRRCWAAPRSDELRLEVARAVMLATLPTAALLTALWRLAPRTLSEVDVPGLAVSPALAVALTGAALSVLGALHLRLRRSTA